MSVSQNRQILMPGKLPVYQYTSLLQDDVGAKSGFIPKIV